MAANPDYPFTRGDAMRRALENAHIKPKAAAATMGIGYRTILEWFNGATPSGDHLAAFIELTNAPWLLDWFQGPKTRSRCFGDTDADRDDLSLLVA